MDLINLFGLNLDPERPIHYIIGVAVYSHPKDEKRGQLYMKYGPIVFTNTDVENLKFALETHKMEIPKTSLDDALKTFDVFQIVGSMSAFLMSCRANNCSVHHFSSYEALDDTFFDHILELANKNDGMLKKLMDAEVRG
jgi:hypothetical protein